MNVLTVARDPRTSVPAGVAYVAGAAREAGHTAELFDGEDSISPELPESYIIELIESLRPREGRSVQANKPFASYEKRVSRLNHGLPVIM